MSVTEVCKWENRNPHFLLERMCETKMDSAFQCGRKLAVSLSLLVYCNFQSCLHLHHLITKGSFKGRLTLLEEANR